MCSFCDKDLLSALACCDWIEQFMYYDIFSRILNTLGQDFQNLAEMCLLVMHLEIRCHCFYFLLQALKQVQYVVKRKFSLYSSPPLYI